MNAATYERTKAAQLRLMNEYASQAEAGYLNWDDERDEWQALGFNTRDDVLARAKGIRAEMAVLRATVVVFN